MKNLKKYLLAILLLAIALVLVACSTTEEPEVKTAKISAITITPTIYDGEIDKPYVIVGEDIYFEAELTADDETLVLGEKETWSIDNSEIAEMKLNDEGGIICTGKKGGNATVTAQNPDGSIKATYTFEVAVSKDATDVLVAANAEIISVFPKYIAADTTLPVPSNPNVTIKYKNNITSGITVTDGVYKYAYDAAKGDVNKGINFTLTYHETKLESVTYFYEVKDINDNLFLAADKVSEKLTALFDTYEKATDKDGNASDLPLLTENKNLPLSYSKEEVGRDVTLAWSTDKDSDTAVLVDENGLYTFEKQLCDTTVLFYATISVYEKFNATVGSTEVIKTGSQYYVANPEGGYTLVTKDTTDYYDKVTEKVTVGKVEVDVDKYYAKEGVQYYTYGPVAKATNTLVIAGATPDEIYQYLQDSHYIPVDGSTTTTNIASLNTTDSKYKGLTIVWSLDPEDKTALITSGKIIYNDKEIGEHVHTITGTFYYNRKVLESYTLTTDITVDSTKTYYTYDETTKVYTAVRKGTAKDELLSTYYECTQTDSYTWMRTYTITVTYNKTK